MLNSIKLLAMKTNPINNQNQDFEDSVKKSFNRIDCIIYDCDGVLFDSLETNRKLYDHIALSMGRQHLSEEELRYCHTHTVFESIHLLFQDNVLLEERALAFLKNNVDLNEFLIYLRMETNLIETLTALKEKGIFRAISTNRTTTMKQIMADFNLTQYFDIVVTALDVTRPKPDSESVEKILRELNIDRDKVIYIGDSDIDRKTAASSGVKFIAYKNTEIMADYFIDDHLDLLKLLSSGIN